MYLASTLGTPLLSIPEEQSSLIGFGYLLVAIIAEVAGTICMKLTTQADLWRIGAYVCYAISFSLFPIILKQIPLSVAYATWSAMGTCSITILSVVFFEEVLSLRQVCATGGILISVVLLQEF